MSDKEKAKAYDEALERAKKLLNKQGITVGSYPNREAIETIFPELQESEDERIRKEIYDFLLNGIWNEGIIASVKQKKKCSEWLAWLEKQKEQKPLSTKETELNSLAFLEQLGYTCIPPSKDGVIEKEIDDLMKKYKDKVDSEVGSSCYTEKGLEAEQKPDKCQGCNNVKGCINCVNGDQWAHIEEQKPINWTELTWKDINELERIINNVHYEFQNGIGEDSFGELVLERFREYKDDGSMDEQKPAECITDEEMKQSRDALHDFKVFATDLAKQFNIDHRRDIDWDNFCAGLLTYLERNKPAEWSEEDEKMRCNILNALTPNLVYSVGKGTSTGTSTYKYDNEINWLKSLKPQRPVDYDHEMWKNCEANFEGGKKEVINNPEKYGLCKSAEWSEEDEENFEIIDGILYGNIDQSVIKEVDKVKILSWLKSFRPSWKPSEEQMEAMKNSAYGTYQNGDGPALRELYDDLLKLKGGK